MAFEWLNETSRTFLSRGYLSKEEKPEERIMTIADNAQKILSKMWYQKNEEDAPEIITNFSELFRENLGKGWYSLSSPVWANFGKERGLPVSCLTGDSWLNTQHEGGTKIKNIKIGDEVLTHKGRYRKVTDIQTRESDGDLYELKVQTRKTPIKITGNHPVLTNLGWVRVDELDPKIHYIATNEKLKYKEKPHTLRFVKSEIATNNRFQLKDLPESLEVDEDLSWALGLWFAEGSVTKRSIRITMGVPFKDTIEKWLSIMTSKFGINGNSYISEVSRNNKINSWISACVNSKTLVNFFNEEFGEGCKNKNLPIWIKDLPKPLLEKFFEGFYLGDGTKTKRMDSFTIANPKLAMSLYEMGLRCGYRMGLNMQVKSGKLSTTRYVYQVMIYCKQDKVNMSVNNARAGISFADGNRYCPFTLNKIEEDELVYDITVEEDHSFSVSGVVVHNCFGSYVEDSCEGIKYADAEIGAMTWHGGGTSAYLGDVRERGASIGNGDSVTEGVNSFLPMYEATANCLKQSSVRRGQLAVYLDADHPDIEDFLDIRADGHAIQDLNFAVCCSDEFMDGIEKGDAKRRKVWGKILKVKSATGFPYIMFNGNADRGRPQIYKDRSMNILASNLCSEIMLPSSKDESFVCVLSSMNLFHYDKWKETNAVQILMMFLDAVNEEFITKSNNLMFMARPNRFAKYHRALGLGILGWHSYLQENMIPFGSIKAMGINNNVFKFLDKETMTATKKMAKWFGETDMMKGTGQRNATRIALAPTKSSSVILGQISRSIEPIHSNYYIDDTAKLEITFKNPKLLDILKERDMNNKDVWASIMNKNGSVQHLACLTDHEKEVFKTFSEVSQMDVINQAAVRQKYIDQGQSLNLMIHPDTPAKEISNLYREGYKLGIKSFYYQRSQSSAVAYNHKLIECSNCEG